ncbi:MAG: single-stranded DNA-binding protein [Streptococcaceae bacterium]|jgi:single-strand DNA-binding protein|nr:single-stranded DNA-binding protein [Streptococcaceae bacterium]
MINNVVLVGRLTKDADLRYTPNNRAVATFTLAVNRQFKNPQGQYDADFINVVIWGQSAEALAKYTSKGSQIGVTGRIQTRNYENQQGQRVYVTEVVADSFQFLESRATSQERGTGNFDSAARQNYTNDAAPNNFSNNSQSSNFSDNSSQQSSNFSRNDALFGGGDAPIDIPDDDLPF